MSAPPDILRSAREVIRVYAGGPGLTRRFAFAYMATLAPLGVMLLICHHIGGWACLALAALVAGFTQNALGILMHEASHTFIHPDRRLNDLLADFLVCLPLFNTTEGYRLPHMGHHRHAGFDRDPHFGWYGRYTSRGQFLRCLLADLCGLTVLGHFRDRYRSSPSRGQQPRYTLPGLILVQAGLIALCWLATGLWWAYLVLWFLPLCTIPHAINRIRTFVEHQPGPGATPANRSTLPTWVEWLLIAPYGYAFHYEHHLLMNVPYYRLRDAHETLIRGHHPYTANELAPHGYLRTFWRLWRRLGAAPASDQDDSAAIQQQRAG